MIQADVSSRLQTPAELNLRPALPAQEITDKLGGLVAGQRLLAEIQALMPNGTYRALINQRSVTLALPFAAKAGDAIELEVAESDGKLTLAVVSRAAAADAKGVSASTTTSLSRTGQLIRNLLGATRDASGGPAPLPLNGNKPIAGSPPNNAQDLLPLLKQAISESGMFYEAHQAEWVEGRFSKTQLLQEPQGRLAPQVTVPQRAPHAGESASAAHATMAGQPIEVKVADADVAAVRSSQPPQAAQPIAPQAQALVQQQLEAFATQNFAWHGQVWPGQQVDWEIEPENGQRDPGRDGGDDNGNRWQTRLRLTLPQLGEVDARLYIHGKQISLAIVANSAETCALLHGEGAGLRGQLEQAGLDLASIGVAMRAGDQAQSPPQ